MLRFLAVTLCLLQFSSGFVPGLLLTRCCVTSQIESAQNESSAETSKSSIAQMPHEALPACCQSKNLTCHDVVPTKDASTASPSARLVRLHCCLDPYGLINKDRPCPMIEAADPDRAIMAETCNFRVTDFSAIITWLAVPSDVWPCGKQHSFRVMNPWDLPHAMPPDRQILHCSWQC
ncbi:hypothetical protein Plim_2807 [Planctopirus limnophila DSM 3776]|uniref:Uncharacterized protein n=1 Tax=Planctopirus limnophila (strain ATCC 43296 / DSM 3776 / IFAM 1008 / Mu 290) TaxID=521674 RepID=D5SRD6_PLAL2|nr:hypothetical protein [Planctopirus limnophila]ADG68629.1 hypothetical protein Plim_2807 [Planctopirus limnophila DSM 3776]